MHGPNARRNPDLKPSQAQTVIAYIGIGGNVGEVAQTMHDAVMLLDAENGVSVLRVSQVFVTPPWGDVAQPDYLNAVVELACSISAAELHGHLQNLERHFGRDRHGETRWGPRTLDLDLLLFGDAVIASETLTVPHPRMLERAFVMIPLLELNPSVRIGDAVTPAAAEYVQYGMRPYGRIFPDVELLG